MSNEEYALINPDIEWMEQAACKGLPTDLWFPDNKTAIDPAVRAICMEMCEVRQECLQFALDNYISHGMWGGLSPKQRKPKQLRLIMEDQDVHDIDPE